jgi:hypothetical protein
LNCFGVRLYLVAGKAGAFFATVGPPVGLLARAWGGRILDNQELPLRADLRRSRTMLEGSCVT